MIYYKKIHIANFQIIQEKTQSFLDTLDWFPRIGFHPLPWRDYVKHCNEIMSAFDEYGIKPMWAATYITYNQVQSQPHVDYRDPKINLCRINIPIKNCEGTFTEFFTGGEYETLVQPTGEKFYVIKPGSVPTKVDQVEINEPTIMRVQEPHRVLHTHDKQRINLTVYTDKDPVFLLE